VPSIRRGFRVESAPCTGFELECAPIAAGTDPAIRRGMNNGLAYEDTIAPELVLPAQFRELWHGPRAGSPEAILAVSVLGQAANDLQNFRFARRRRFQRLYMEAYEWVASNDRSWPYAFVNLCDALALSATSARAHLLGDAPAIVPVNADRAATATPRRLRERVAAPVFRLSRAANLKPMMIMRPSTGRRRSRVSTRRYASQGTAAS